MDSSLLPPYRQWPLSLCSIKPGGCPSVSHMRITFKYLATAIFGGVCSQSKVHAVSLLPQVTSWQLVISSVEGVPKAACLPQLWGLGTSHSSSVRGHLHEGPFVLGMSQGAPLASGLDLSACLPPDISKPGSCTTRSRQSPVSAPFPGPRPFSPPQHWVLLETEPDLYLPADPSRLLSAPTRCSVTALCWG